MSNPFETIATQAVPATEAQIRFMTTLIREHMELQKANARYLNAEPNVQETIIGFIEAAILECPTWGKMHTSMMIDRYKTANSRLRTENRAAVPASAPAGETLERGVYRDASGKVFRVYKARGGSHMLAAELTEDGPEYAGRADRFVKPSERVSRDEAAQYGRQFGICCVCGADLEDPTSVAAGIGPVCARNY